MMEVVVLIGLTALISYVIGYKFGEIDMLRYLKRKLEEEKSKK